MRSKLLKRAHFEQDEVLESGGDFISGPGGFISHLARPTNGSEASYLIEIITFRHGHPSSAITGLWQVLDMTIISRGGCFTSR